jgi:hypothetical protein
MNTAVRALTVSTLIALCPATAFAGDDDFMTLLPVHPLKAERPHAEAPPKTDFHAAMDRVFGAGRWRETSGYRTEAQEDELRREGAGTVPLGHLSHHSMGTPDAPGAYDVVVAGMSTQGAAEKLRRSGESFVKVLAEGAHGAQGSHLHIEPGAGLAAAGADAGPAPKVAEAPTIYLRIVGGRRNPLLDR